jgi:5'-nucleotidase
VFKADADAASAVVVRAGLSPDGDFEVRSHQVVELGPDGPAPDPRVATRVREWLRSFDLVHCVVDLGLTASCLDEHLGRTRVELVAEELQIRRFETNVGNFAADLMLDAYADRGAQVAFVNSGSLRLNQNLPEDSYVERRHLEELFAYPARLRLLRLDGRTLQQVLEHSVEAWTGSGWWLQVAGMTFRHDPDAGTVSELSLLTASGPRPIRPDEQIIAVTNEFLVDPDGGQDGYTMLHPGQTIDEGPGPDLKHLVAEALAAAGEQGIAPRIEGRICNTQREGPCLLSN